MQPALLASIFVLSVMLGRLLPGWGFAAPVVLAAASLAVVLAETEPGMGRGLAVVYICIGVAIAEAGVLLGSLAAAWTWTSRGLRESSRSGER
jgi:NADH:ubiquinone oxidoreductase subunit K